VYAQQPYQPAPPQQTGHVVQPEPLPGTYHQQPVIPVAARGAIGKRTTIVAGLVAVAVIGGGLGIFLATEHTGSSLTVHRASAAGFSPSASATSAQPSATTAANPPASGAAGVQSTADLLTTNQVCPSFLAIEQPLIAQMNQITDEASGAKVFETFQPKFADLAASTPVGPYKAEIQSVADDLNAIMSYIKANPHMPKPAPAAFDTELNTFQTDSDTVNTNCDPLGTSTS
jgi:hypothetical protein